MSRKVLTDRAIKALKAAPAGKRAEVLDALVPGLGIRITDRGKKTFFLRSRFPGSSSRNHPTRRALGEYGAMSLEQARESARRWHELLRQGIDPQSPKRSLRTATASASAKPMPSNER